MFNAQYKFYGKHAKMVKDLTNVFDQKSKAKMLNRNVDVYVIAPLVGFLYGRRAEKDSTIKQDVNVMGDRVIYSENELKFSYRLIMLLDENYTSQLEERLNKAFRNYGDNPEDEEYFDSYVRGGVEVLHEKLIESAIVENDYILNLKEFILEFNERFNEEIQKEDILSYLV